MYTVLTDTLKKTIPELAGNVIEVQKIFSFKRNSALMVSSDLSKKDSNKRANITGKGYTVGSEVG